MSHVTLQMNTAFEDIFLQNRKLKIGIVVGEVSGDTLGVQLMRSFREQGFDV